MNAITKEEIEIIPDSTHEGMIAVVNSAKPVL